MNAILDIQKQIIEEFGLLATWEEKYKHLIALGKTLPPYPEDKRLDTFKVKGCQSQVWLFAEFDGKTVHYAIDSDAMIVKGLACLLHRTFSGHTPQEIAQAPMDFLQEIGLTSHLSQSRSNGMAAMVRQFKNYAVAYEMLAKTQKP